MSDWFPKQMDPEHELKVADALLHKADALLRRHRSSSPAPEPDVEVPLDDEDLPILTEVVEDFAPAQPASPQPAPAQPPAPVPERSETEDAATLMAENLIELDTAIQREVEAWFTNELPQVLSRELDRLSDRLREEALTHLRSTLLPALSERISRSLSDVSRPER